MAPTFGAVVRRGAGKSYLASGYKGSSFLLSANVVAATVA